MFIHWYLCIPIFSFFYFSSRSHNKINEALFSAVAVKKGSPSYDELEELSEKIPDTWRKLGRRLHFEEEKLICFHKENEEVCEKAYAMLRKWKQSGDSDATYQVLYDALCHKLVNRRDLAEKFCCNGWVQVFDCVLEIIGNESLLIIRLLPFRLVAVN